MSILKILRKLEIGDNKTQLIWGIMFLLIGLGSLFVDIDYFLLNQIDYVGWGNVPTPIFTILGWVFLMSWIYNKIDWNKDNYYNKIVHFLSLPNKYNSQNYFVLVTTILFIIIVFITIFIIILIKN